MSRATTFFSPRRNRAALRRLMRRFGRRETGVAAVEFGFIMPIMVTMFFGLVETTQGVMIDRKVTLLNRTLADLTSQATVIDTTEKNNIFAASTATVAPFPENSVGMTVSSVVVNSSGVAKVCWTESLNMTGLAEGSTITLPTGLNVPSTSLIVAKSDYSYTPTVGYTLTGTIHIGGDAIYMRPRLGKKGGTQNIEQVERTGKSMCPS